MWLCLVRQVVNAAKVALLSKVANMRNVPPLSFRGKKSADMNLFLELTLSIKQVFSIVSFQP
jgi:hypothetical protein